jgi:uncharacterized protein
MIVFAYKGNIDWTLGAVMGVGSIAGGIFGARVFLLLAVVISAELVHLAIHYVFKTT